MSHFDSSGNAHMVDVSAKLTTVRVAVASGAISMLKKTADSIRQGNAKKGDVLAIARLAGISGSKWTSHLIPLCHAIPIEAVSIDFAWQSDPSVSGSDSATETLVCRARATTTAKTGVEMEAMTAVSVAALTVYDMVKSTDRALEIGPIRLEEKSGGKSGRFRREIS